MKKQSGKKAKVAKRANFDARLAYIQLERKIDRRLADLEKRLATLATATPDYRVVEALEHMAAHQDIRGALLALTEAMNRSTEMAKLFAGRI